MVESSDVANVILRKGSKNNPISENQSGTRYVDCQYDIFIGYCIHDSKFAIENLQKPLESDELGKEKLKLYMYHRDSIAGGFLGDELSQKMDESKCLLIVLSDKYLAMPWHDFELKIAAFNVSTYEQKMVIVELQPCGKQTGCTVIKGSLDLNGTSVPVSIQKILKMCKDNVDHIVVKYAENTPAVLNETTIEEIRRLAKASTSPPQKNRITMRESILMPMAFSSQYTMLTNIGCVKCHQDLYLAQVTSGCCNACNLAGNDDGRQLGDGNPGIIRNTGPGREMARQSKLLSDFLDNYIVPTSGDVSKVPSHTRSPSVIDVQLEAVLIKPDCGSDPKTIRLSFCQYMRGRDTWLASTEDVIEESELTE